MDLLTQGVLGSVTACLASEGKIERKKTVMIGALIGMSPDADLLMKLFISSPFTEILYHRALTHSLFFAPFIMFLARTVFKILKREDLNKWLPVIFWSLITHPLLDLFTNSGTQLLQPFSNHRFSLNAVPSVDLIYSVPLAISVFFLYILKNDKVSYFINRCTIFLTTTYLFVGLMAYDNAYDIMCVEAQTKKWVGNGQIFTGKMTVFNKRAIFYEKDKIHIAHLNTLKLNKLEWKTFNNQQFIQPSKDIDIFTWFTSGHILYEKHDSGFYLSDVRSGNANHNAANSWVMDVDKNGNFQKWHKKPDILSRLQNELSLIAGL
ncbi:MAG: hypothetical protein COY39_05945 [Alphaproteobacteria bacterium CG_4_10_14_0_8_um_filter_37_21]|nr:MAG: hypothetical protein COY39_05945 [Alphaproteobacteria bacterium CG_4_10_14_0_8_um_filter_37_21]